LSSNDLMRDLQHFNALGESSGPYQQRGVPLTFKRA